MGWADTDDSDESACQKLVEGVLIQNADLKVPSPSDLGHVGTDETFALMASQALASGSPQNNPKVPSHSEIVQLYKDIW